MMIVARPRGRWGRVTEAAPWRAKSGRSAGPREAFVRNRSSTLHVIASELRAWLTPSEAALWQLINAGALRRLGYRVLRLEAELVLKHLEQAIALIRAALAAPP